ncbi:MAG: Crp/Fnr family transcriptional regulator [Caulobacteraceae bacterium]
MSARLDLAGSATRNLVLAGMVSGDLEALLETLVSVRLPAGEVICEQDQRLAPVWFPLTAVASVVTLMKDGRAVESETVGCEGAIGILDALGASPCAERTIIQIPGIALRLPAASLRARFERSGSLRHLLVRHVQAHLVQARQSTACNALHGVGQRLARWLLTSLDRTGGASVPLTQQYLALMLGAQRTTVNQAVVELAREGVIGQRRGGLDILDRAGLEARSCECYRAVRNQLARLIGQAPNCGV